MKHLFLTLAWQVGWTASCLSLSSCAPTPPEWQGKPDPLDTPEVEIVEPAANGHWGPFGAAPLSHRNFNGSP